MYEIRRAIWFIKPAYDFQPCDDNLSRQLEDGYRKFSPWKGVDQASQKRWALFGPYMNHLVLYVNSSEAWLQTDGMQGKLARAVNMVIVMFLSDY